MAAIDLAMPFQAPRVEPHLIVETRGIEAGATHRTIGRGPERRRQSLAGLDETSASIFATWRWHKPRLERIEGNLNTMPFDADEACLPGRLVDDQRGNATAGYWRRRRVKDDVVRDDPQVRIGCALRDIGAISRKAARAAHLLVHVDGQRQRLPHRVDVTAHSRVAAAAWPLRLASAPNLGPQIGALLTRQCVKAPCDLRG